MKRLIPLLFLVQCFNVHPTHARDIKMTEVPINLKEGSRSAWTRCVASIVARESPFRCGAKGDTTVCTGYKGSLFATIWTGDEADAYWAPPKMEPISVAEVVEYSLVSAVVNVGKTQHKCEVMLSDGRAVVAHWVP